MAVETPIGLEVGRRRRARFLDGSWFQVNAERDTLATARFRLLKVPYP
jgi:hypothetical protein